MERESMKGYLFNCDKTCELKEVEALLFEMEEKHNLKIDVEKLYFGLKSMSEICDSKIPHLKIDFAVFAVHADESRLSINEENAGIGYAKLYKALSRATGDKVLIVIAGDKDYKDKTEQEQFVISRWARRKVASQFDDEYLDGRKSFILSWNSKHRTIHEEALLHFFDPNKEGQKFQYQPKPKPLPEFQVTSSVTTPGEGDKVIEEGASDQLMDNDVLNLEHEKSTQDERSEEYGGADTTPTLVNHPKGTVLLETHLRYGKISSENKDVVEWQQGWQPSEIVIQDLEEKWKLVPDAEVLFTADGDGLANCAVKMNPWQNFKYHIRSTQMHAHAHIRICACICTCTCICIIIMIIIIIHFTRG